MERLKEIETELSGIAPILGKNGITAQPYRVPAGYFEHFAENLFFRIRTTQGNRPPETEMLHDRNALSGPEAGAAEAGFDQVIESRQANHSTADEEDPYSELESLSPLLASLERKTPYQAPAGYFNEFRANSSRVARPKAKLFSLGSGSRIMKYAAAAVVTGVIAVTAFFTFHKTSTDPITGLARISDQEMVNYLENQDVHWMPDGSSPQTAAAGFNADDISDLLSNVSDAELEQYVSDFPIQKLTTN